MTLLALQRFSFVVQSLSRSVALSQNQMYMAFTARPIAIFAMSPHPLEAATVSVCIDQHFHFLTSVEMFVQMGFK